MDPDLANPPQDADPLVAEGRLAALLTADGLLAPPEIDFGTVTIGGGGTGSATQRLTLINYGSEDVLVRSVSITQGYAQFSVPPVPVTTLHPGDSLDVNVTFSPVLGVPTTGILSIDSNAEGFEGRIDLTGIGQRADEPEIQVTFFANNLQGGEIGKFNSGYLTKPEVSNQGTRPLTVTEIRVAAGQGQDEYAINPNFPTLPVTLLPGESFRFDFSFRPSRAGLRPGAFEVVSNDPQTPVVRLPVVGTGVVTNDDFITFEGVHIGETFVAVEDSAAQVQGDTNLPVLRTRTDDAGNWEFFLPQNTSIHVATFDPVSGLIAHGYTRTNAAGQRTDVNIGVFAPSVYSDSDGDGLPDDVEFAIGTSPNNPDTDGDGKNDFAEIDGGLNPLDDRPAVTGVVAALKLPDRTTDIVLATDPADATRQLAYLATGAGGLAIVDVTRFDQPVVRGQLALPSGISRFVALDPEQRRAAVSAGSAGLHIVDVSDSAKPVRQLTLNINAGPATFYDGLIYVGVGTEIQAFDPLTGEPTDTLPLGGGNVLGLARAGSLLWVLTAEGSAGALRTVDLSGVQMVARGTLALSRVGRSLAVADGVAWIASGNEFSDQGTTAVDVSLPDNLRLLNDADRSRHFVNAIALNGSGLGVLAGASIIAANEPVASVEVIRVDNPAVVPPVFTNVLLPQPGEDVSLSSGIAYVADGYGGLQVVNFLAFDQGDTPPVINLGEIAGDLDPVRTGLQLAEASTVVIPARITDDVQVRSVELLVNGAVVRTELSYPYDLSTVLPKIADAGAQVTLQLRATDTGGNVRLSIPIIIDLIPDLTPPTIDSIDPPDGTTQQVSRRQVNIQFSEPLDRTTTVAADFVLNGPAGSRRAALVPRPPARRPRGDLLPAAGRRGLSVHNARGGDQRPRRQSARRGRRDLDLPHLQPDPRANDSLGQRRQRRVGRSQQLGRYRHAGASPARRGGRRADRRAQRCPDHVPNGHRDREQHRFERAIPNHRRPAEPW